MLKVNQPLTSKSRTNLAQLFRNGSWMGLAQVARAIDITIRSIILANFLSLFEYGLYAVALAFAGIVSELANLNFGVAVLTFGPAYQEQGKLEKVKALIRVSYELVLVTVAASLAISWAALSVQCWLGIYSKELVLPTVVITTTSTLALIDGTNKAHLRHLNKFRMSCIVDLITAPLNVLLLLLLVSVVDPSASSAIYASTCCCLIPAIASTLVAVFVLKREMPSWYRASRAKLAGEFL